MLTDLTTPTTLATELGVSVGDERLPRAIAVASDSIRRYLNRPVLHYSSAYVEKVRGFGSPRLVLGLTPVVSVASVALEDGALVTDFVIEDATVGFLYRDAGWPWTGLVRPGLLYSDPAMGSEKASIVVTYTGGWVTPEQAQSIGWTGPARSLPYDLEEACVQTAVALYRKGGNDPSIASEALGDYSVSYRNPNIGVGAGGILPDAVLSILDSYRRPLT